MKELIIKYRAVEGKITSRRITNIRPNGDDKIYAYCHLRDMEMGFMISGIVEAVIPSSGELIENIYTFLNLKTPTDFNNPIQNYSNQQESINEKSLERLRRKEKSELFKRFRLRVIINHYKQKFFECFDNQCFKCKKEKHLVIDHHIPMSLGGHLIPGNLVALCRKCNGQKWDNPPEKFYSRKELQELQQFLIKEKEVFEFEFNWDFWNKDREGYLISLGIDRKLVHQVLNDKNHVDYIEE
ncbi:HNH endonuclease [Leptospira sp. FAT2]|uniref:HNH endonuclease n=1 Tax=Leptospira sanjuanensis TaxID=2879643 RepID=UPI001EE91BD4|nr:HNH endonuclease [Leptospira sanjuanensis]MCG6170143.1 HNH endonuclease [Leptospira sanjuanensis]MCG6195481.1 HNH endonuclease [Leptospira sanjuanensis]